MPTRGILEVLIHSESFRNIDLYYQGLYFIQFTAYFKDETCEVHAIPIQIQPSEHISHSKSLHNLWPAQIDDENNAYMTKIFLIRYSDETVKCGEVGIFRAEIEFDLTIEQIPLIIEAELFFSDLEGNVEAEYIRKIMKDPVLAPQFKSVGNAQFKVANPFFGVNQMIPVIFTDLYSCVLNTTIHVLLLDYKFDADHQAESLFPEIQTKLKSKAIDRAYDTFVLLLATVHNNIRNLVSKVMKAEGARYKISNIKKRIKLPVLIGLKEGQEYAKTDTGVRRALFSECMTVRNKQSVTDFIINEIKEVAANLCQIKYDLGEVLRHNSEIVFEILQIKYNTTMRERWGENIYRAIKPLPYTVIADHNTQDSHNSVAEARRKSNYMPFLEALEVEDLKVFLRPDLSTILFEDVFIREKFQDSFDPICYSTKSKFEPKTHLFILVHGFMGSYYDMKIIKDTLSLFLPNSSFFSSRANEGKTEGSIFDMGYQLAMEVKSILEEFQYRAINRISFIGHSLGGLIIRAALPHLSELKEKLNLYMTFGSPHLGCICGSSKLIDAGLWLLAKLKKTISLQQLAMTDSKNPRKTCIYSLSRAEGLGWFKKIILVSSSQDNYVPFESARIEAGKSAFEGDTLQLEMADGLISQIRADLLYRIDVNFGMKDDLLSNMIGRTAHVQMLDNPPLLNMLLYLHPDAFC
ncbi:unnamed protein product [Blepharisma stoltei]|uniref:DUF676 domain-containing protein n=1 Tax=Blepharisma stoltei TaxID=1481888 RepID=A0AAU9K9A8_9CILI|nr:unnamed protein product [Blepharisma stoltei]